MNSCTTDLRKQNRAVKSAMQSSPYQNNFYAKGYKLLKVCTMSTIELLDLISFEFIC